jgi:hypothetical protein
VGQARDWVMRVLSNAQGKNNNRAQKIALHDSTCFFSFVLREAGKLASAVFGNGIAFWPWRNSRLLDQSSAFIGPEDDHDQGIDCLCKNTSAKMKAGIAKIVCKIILREYPNAIAF